MTCEHGHCITCSDEGIELRVLALDGDTARCAGDGGAETEVDVALVAPVAPGDAILAHAGVAIARLEVAA